MKKKNIRMTVDISMTVLLPMLMAYSLIGEKFHEIAGKEHPKKMDDKGYWYND